jgi:plastocyanin
MMRNWLRRGGPRLAAASICLPLLLGACSKSNDPTVASSGDGGTTTSTASASVNAGPTISVTEFAFDPDPSTVKVGQVVTWKNDGSAKHEVAEDVPSGQTPTFDSPVMNSGQTFTQTFDKPGTYNYICRIHPTKMKGTITVTS